MKTVNDINKNLLYTVEHFCNNFFNKDRRKNDPEGERDYPPAFIELVGQIQEYRDKQKIPVDPDKPGVLVTSLKDADSAVAFALDERLAAAWTSAFAHDLQIYRRVKTV
jgi:hypothetical protein